jgi:fibronectin type 3 domain-containing protein
MRKRAATVGFTVIVALLATLTSCDVINSLLGTGSAELSVLPTFVSVQAGQSTTFTVTAKDKKGDPESFSVVSQSLAIATVSPFGSLVTVNGVAQGQTNVLVESVSGLQKMVQVIVTAPANGSPSINMSFSPNPAYVGSLITVSSGATDPNPGDALTYAWTMVTNPGAVALNNATQANATFTPTQVASYVVQVSVSDGHNPAVLKTITIPVVAPPNSPPTVNPSFLPTAPATTPTINNQVNLSAGASDPDSDALSYFWSAVSGPTTPAINLATSASANFTVSQAGTYVVRVSVNDGHNASVNRDLTIAVGSGSSNQPPVANIQASSLNVSAGTAVSLNGAGSTDDHAIGNYSWVITQGANNANLTPSGSTATFSSSIAGTYKVSLTVSDNGFDGTSTGAALTNTTTVTITVTPVVGSATLSLGSTSVSLVQGASTNVGVQALTAAGAADTFAVSSNSAPGVVGADISATGIQLNAYSVGSASIIVRSGSGVEKTLTVTVTAQTVDTLATPQPAFGFSDATKVEVKWSAVANAGEYAILRANLSDGVYVEVMRQTSNDFWDYSVVSGETYQYAVVAYKGSVQSGYGYTASITIQAQAVLYPTTAPSGVVPTPDYYSVALSWPSVYLADRYEIQWRNVDALETYDPVRGTVVNATGWTKTGLLAGTQYYFRLRGGNANGYGPWSGDFYAKTKTVVQDILAPPAMLNATPAIQSVGLSWSTVPAAVRYNVYRAPSQFDTYVMVGYTTPVMLSYNDNGLTPNTTYYYAVCAVSSSNVEGNRAFKAVATLIDPATQAPQAAPVVTYASAIDSASGKIGWNAVSGATGYYLYSSTSYSDVLYESALAPPEDLAATGDTEQYTVAGQSPETIVYFKLRAYNGNGAGPATDVYQFTTLAAVEVAPATPDTPYVNNYGFDYDAASYGGWVDIVWSAVDGATSYTVQVSTDNWATFEFDPATTTVDTPSIHLAGLGEGVTYQYRVFATNGTGSSGFSDENSHTVPIVNPPAAPGKPRIVFAYRDYDNSTTNTTRLVLSWTAVPLASGYLFEYSVDGQNWAQVEATGTTVDESTLRDDIGYFRLVAVNALGRSPATSFQPFTLMLE